MTTTLRSFGELKDFMQGVETDARDADYTGDLEQLSDDLAVEHIDSFAAGETPGGGALAPLALSTINKKGHDRILQETDSLMESLTTGNSDTIRDIVKGGGFHHLAWGTSDEKSIFHTLGGANLPQREHVGASEAVIDKFAEDLADSVVDNMR